MKRNRFRAAWLTVVMSFSLVLQTGAAGYADAAGAEQSETMTEYESLSEADLLQLESETETEISQPASEAGTDRQQPENETESEESQPVSETETAEPQADGEAEAEISQPESEAGADRQQPENETESEEPQPVSETEAQELPPEGDTEEASETDAEQTDPVAEKAQKPAAPTGFCVSGTQDGVRLDWNPAEGAERYQVLRSDSNTTVYNHVYNAGNELSYLDNSVTAGQTYRYTVRAVNAAGCSPNAAGKSITIGLIRPEAPSSVTVSVTDGGIRVAWSASAGAEGYYVLRSDTNTTAYQHITRLDNVTEYTDSTVEYGNTYRYTVRAYNAAGTSANAPGKSITVLVKPSAPASLAVSNTDAGVKLQWSAVTGAQGYYVLRSDTNTTTYQHMIKTDNVTEYTDSAVEAGKTYRYTVRAYNAAGTSVNAPGKSITYQRRPSAPTGLVLSCTAEGVSIQWDAAAGATGYYVLRSDTNTTTYQNAFKAGNTTAYTDTTVKEGTVYRYTVKAYNAAGNSVNASGKSIQYVIPGPETPGGFTADAYRYGVKLSWSASAGADGYEIFRGVGTDGSLVRYVSLSDQCEYLDSSVTVGYTYRYAVRAYSDAGSSEFTEIISVTVPSEWTFETLTENAPVTKKMQDAEMHTYQFTASAAGTYTFASSGSLDVKATLYEDSGLATQLVYDDDSGEGYNFSISYQLKAKQTVYLKVERYTYQLQEDTYTLTVTMELPELTNNGQATESITAGANVLYRITAYSAGSYAIYTEGALDTVGELYQDASLGTMLAADDNGNGSGNFRITYEFEAGQSLILLIRGKTAASSGTFTVKVQKLNPGTTLYRAVIIGEATYSSGSNLTGPIYDIDAVGTALSASGYEVNAKLDAGAAEIRQMIHTAFADASEDDISLFYYSGHGVTSQGSYSGALALGNGDFITPAQLATWLSAVPGTIVVMLDCCGSGAAISRDKDASNGFDTAAFNSSFISAFRDAEPVARYGELAKTRFKVLTASAAHQSSWEGTADGGSGGFFTKGVLRSFGYTYYKTWLQDMPGDTDNDSAISLTEAHAYAQTYVNSIGLPQQQDVQIYPAGDSTVFMIR